MNSLATHLVVVAVEIAIKIVTRILAGTTIVAATTQIAQRSFEKHSSFGPSSDS